MIVNFFQLVISINNSHLFVLKEINVIYAWNLTKLITEIIIKNESNSHYKLIPDTFGSIYNL